MGVLAIAQYVGMIAALSECGYLFLLVEVVEDGSVVVGTYGKGAGSEMSALLQGGAALLLVVYIEKLGIVVHGGHYHHVFVILGSCTNQRDASNINLFNDILLGSVAGCLKLSQLSITYENLSPYSYRIILMLQSELPLHHLFELLQLDHQL